MAFDGFPADTLLLLLLDSSRLLSRLFVKNSLGPFAKLNTKGVSSVCCNIGVLFVGETGDTDDTAEVGDTGADDLLDCTDVGDFDEPVKAGEFNEPVNTGNSDRTVDSVNMRGDTGGLDAG